MFLIIFSLIKLYSKKKTDKKILNALLWKKDVYNFEQRQQQQQQQNKDNDRRYFRFATKLRTKQLEAIPHAQSWRIGLVQGLPGGW